MADGYPNTIVNGSTKEAVAYAMLVGIASSQGLLQIYGTLPVIRADLEWFKKNYSTCLALASGDPV